jgi:flagellar hook-length control protein FliK
MRNKSAMPATVNNLLLNPPSSAANRQSNSPSAGNTDFDNQLKTAQQAGQPSPPANSDPTSNATAPAAKPAGGKQAKAGAASGTSGQTQRSAVRRGNAQQTGSSSDEESPVSSDGRSDNQPQEQTDEPSVQKQQKPLRHEPLAEIPNGKVNLWNASNGGGAAAAATTPVAQPTASATTVANQSATATQAAQVEPGPAQPQAKGNVSPSTISATAQQAAADESDASVDTANEDPGTQATNANAASANKGSTKTATAASSDNASVSDPTAAKANDTANQLAPVSLDAATTVAAVLPVQAANTPMQTIATGQAAAANATASSATARFAETNHPNIVTSVHTALLPKGGTMQLRLDPPELGAVQVSVDVRNGVVNATFQTSNDDATRLLSHSLGQLKTALEAQGVSVEKISVQQTPKDHKSQNDSNGRQPDDRSQQQQQSDQDRRENLRRMWRRISGNGSDPLDLVA